MAKISFEQFQQNSQNNSNGNRMKLFSLKNHGDEAIVRIMENSTDDFDIITCHPVKIGNGYRKVNCIRDPKSPVDACPLCRDGEKIQQRFFIKMIEYVRQDDGSFVPTPVVWERTAREYAIKLGTLINEYGPLSDLIFKIRRNGQAGDMHTTYEIMYVDQNKYNENVFNKVEGAFDNYSVLGTIVLDKNAQEIEQFIQTGNFPGYGENKNLDVTPTNPPANTNNNPFETGDKMPWENDTPVSTGDRATRYY